MKVSAVAIAGVALLATSASSFAPVLQTPAFPRSVALDAKSKSKKKKKKTSNPYLQKLSGEDGENTIQTYLDTLGKYEAENPVVDEEVREGWVQAKLALEAMRGKEKEDKEAAHIAAEKAEDEAVMAVILKRLKADNPDAGEKVREGWIQARAALEAMRKKEKEEKAAAHIAAVWAEDDAVMATIKERLKAANPDAGDEVRKGWIQARNALEAIRQKEKDDKKAAHIAAEKAEDEAVMAVILKRLKADNPDAGDEVRKGWEQARLALEAMRKKEKEEKAAAQVAAGKAEADVVMANIKERLAAAEANGEAVPKAEVPQAAAPVAEKPKRAEPERRAPGKLKDASKYDAIVDLEEKAFAILLDLGLIKVTPDPDGPGYDHSKDDEIADGTVFLE